MVKSTVQPLQRNSAQFPTPVMGSLPPPTTPAPGAQMPSSGLSRHLYSCAHTHTHTHTQIHMILKFTKKKKLQLRTLICVPKKEGKMGACWGSAELISYKRNRFFPKKLLL